MYNVTNCSIFEIIKNYLSIIVMLSEKYSSALIIWMLQINSSTEKIDSLATVPEFTVSIDRERCVQPCSNYVFEPSLYAALL